MPPRVAPDAWTAAAAAAAGAGAAAGGGRFDFVVVVVVVVVGGGGADDDAGADSESDAGGGGGLSTKGSHAVMAAKESARVLRIDTAMPTCSSAARPRAHLVSKKGHGHLSTEPS